MLVGMEDVGTLLIEQAGDSGNKAFAVGAVDEQDGAIGRAHRSSFSAWLGVGVHLFSEYPTKVGPLPIDIPRYSGPAHPIPYHRILWIDCSFSIRPYQFRDSDGGLDCASS